jgi:hypothetical protein
MTPEEPSEQEWLDAVDTDELLRVAREVAERWAETLALLSDDWLP